MTTEGPPRAAFSFAPTFLFAVRPRPQDSTDVDTKVIRLPTINVPNTISPAVEMAADIGAIGVSVTPVSRIAVAGPVTITISRIAKTIAISRRVAAGVG